jgi:hypothetical protein
MKIGDKNQFTYKNENRFCIIEEIKATFIKGALQSGDKSYNGDKQEYRTFTLADIKNMVIKK